MRLEQVDVVGAGGIGTTVGTRLQWNGVRVRYVEANPKRLELGQQETRNARSDMAPAEMIHFEDWQPEPNAWICLCVKCYDNSTVLAKVPRTATLIPVQNGFDPQLDSWGHAVEGIASFVARVDANQFAATITRPGDLHFGPRRPGDGETILAELRRIFASSNGSARPAEFVSNILPIKFTKLLYNSAVSPLAAAAGIDNGELLSHPMARKLFFGLLQENYTILTAAGCELGRVGPFHPRTVMRILNQRWLAWLLSKRFEPSLRGTYCSMAGEIERGRTEIDNYTGYLLKLAQSRVNAPLNEAVYRLVTRMQAERATPHIGVLNEL